MSDASEYFWSDKEKVYEHNWFTWVELVLHSLKVTKLVDDHSGASADEKTVKVVFTGKIWFVSFDGWLTFHRLIQKRINLYFVWLRFCFINHGNGSDIPQQLENVMLIAFPSASSLDRDRWNVNNLIYLNKHDVTRFGSGDLVRNYYLSFLNLPNYRV